ncbi:MAG: ATP-grasp domain-containing protein [Firmicutes bacterium]|nr:ATP-grasp domain-containing protein [Bacillota bacterium]
MNVLLTSAGRRTSLLEAFKEAVYQRGGKVFAGDIDGLAPSLYLADQGFKLPKAKSPEYIPCLLELIEKHKIRLIVPTIDTELPALSAASAEFKKRGCTALVSSEELVAISGDKWRSVKTFGERGLRVPRSWLPEEIAPENQTNLPESLFIKPRDGSASQNTYRVSRSSLTSLLTQVPNPIIQEDIDSPEITIDALLDLNGRIIHFVPRLRIRTLAGESIQGVTIADTKIRSWLIQALDVIASLGGRGPITLQAFLTEGGPTISEVNPRFGGGFPLTLAAGGNYPEWILEMLEGKDVSPRLGEYKKGLYMTRYYVEIFKEEPLWQ